MRVGPEDDAKVAAAIRAAEARTDGEIQAIVAPASDSYADAVLHWALLAALLPLALATAFPAALVRVGEAIRGDWNATPPLPLLVGILLVATVAAFVAAWAALRSGRLRLAFVPAATKARRVRARAILLFRAGTEARTASATGVLIYLSIAEHRAEIVADAAIHAKVDDRRWGIAMAALLERVAAGRAGDGIAAAVEHVGDVLAEHFPRTGTDPNELPDRLLRL